MKLADVAPQRSWNDYRKRVEDEHSVIFGMTRFGKTYLAERLAAMRVFVVVHDPKAEYVLRGYRACATLAELQKLTSTPAKIAKNPKLIYQPDTKHLRDEGEQDGFFTWVYQRGDTMCIIDELTSVSTRRTDMPQGLVDCYARGNGRAVSIMGLTQEPTWVPSMAMTQARHRYTFYVANLDHQKRVCTYMPGPVAVPGGEKGLTPDLIAQLPKRHFYYYRLGEKATSGPWKVGPGDKL